jgi:hypothetical protein
MLDLDLQGGGMDISDKYRACMKIEDRSQSAAKRMAAFLRRAASITVSFFDPVLNIAILEQNRYSPCQKDVLGQDISAVD